MKTIFDLSFNIIIILYYIWSVKNYLKMYSDKIYKNNNVIWEIGQ